MMEFRKYDPITHRNYREKIRSNDLPPEVGAGFVGQFSGNMPFAILVNGTEQINHTEQRIAQGDVVEVVSLFPFKLRPIQAGFYIVHHKRIDRLYSASTLSYELTLKLDGNQTQGLDNDILDIQQIANGTTFDYAKTTLTAAIYCNGTTDTIALTLSHNANISRTIGSVMGENSITHTTLWYAGNNPEHGVIP